jgi:hypothetical protein
MFTFHDPAKPEKTATFKYGLMQLISLGPRYDFDEV